MKKVFIGMFIAMAFAMPAHAEVATSTAVFPADQQALIDWIIRQIYELQRQLQAQLIVEAQDKQDASDLKERCSGYQEEIAAIMDRMELNRNQYDIAYKEYYRSGDPYDYQALPKINADYQNKDVELRAEWQAKADERNKLCN